MATTSNLKLSTDYMNDPQMLFVDLFCGAGGTTTGIEHAQVFNKRVGKVIACVNHDKNAIVSHQTNHPGCLHFTEDIRTLDLTALVAVVRHARKKYPNAKVCLWASLECTNFSKAKGGLPRDADSRTLAEHLLRYLDAINFDYVFIENVEEFMSWGPLDKNGKPVSKTKGSDYIKWVDSMKAYGFNFEHRMLNSADYGAHTSRRRYFGSFSRPALPVCWPAPSHNRNGTNGLLKWRAVKEVLDFSDEGESIFHNLFQRDRSKALAYICTKVKPKKKSVKKHVNLRSIVVFPATYKDPQYGMEPKLIINRCDPKQYDKKKEEARFNKLVKDYCVKHTLEETDVSFYLYDPLSEQTNMRVLAGLIKYVAKGDTSFLKKYYSGRPKGKVNSINGPCPVISTGAGIALVQTSFLEQANTGDPKGMVSSIEDPSRTLTAKGGNLRLVQPVFLLKYNSVNQKTGKHVPPSIDEPAPTIDTGGRLGIIQADFMLYYYGQNTMSSVEQPCNTLRTKDTGQLVQPEFLTRDKIALMHTHWIDRPFTQGGGKHSSIDDPVGSITTVPKMNLVDAWVMSPHFDNKGSSIDDPIGTITANRKHHCLMFPQWGINCSSSIERPSPVLPARMDKMAPQMIQADENNGMVGIILFEDDSKVIEEIKVFMATYGIVDIKMRMLRIQELKRITGFDDDYVLVGTQEEAKKYIGNAVPVLLAQAIIESFAEALITPIEREKAA